MFPCPQTDSEAAEASIHWGERGDLAHLRRLTGGPAVWVLRAGLGSLNVPLWATPIGSVGKKQKRYPHFHALQGYLALTHVHPETIKPQCFWGFCVSMFINEKGRWCPGEDSNFHFREETGT